MKLHTLEAIERAIEGLNREELGELYAWLDRFDPHPVDQQIAEDLAAGRFDESILNALDDEENSRTRPL